MFRRKLELKFNQALTSELFGCHSNPAAGWVLNTVEHEFDLQEVEKVIGALVLVDEWKERGLVKFPMLDG